MINTVSQNKLVGSEWNMHFFISSLCDREIRTEIRNWALISKERKLKGCHGQTFYISEAVIFLATDSCSD
jgi:hypothetical protein